MGKYLLLWEIDASRLPVSRKERAAGWKALLNFVKEDMKAGKTLEWGAYVGELNGFSIIDADDVEISILLQRYSPFVHFKARALLGVEDAEKLIEGMQE
ncbi:MAG: hypothetical protein ACFFFB_05495 [Candidatus Heimdallarchaeota archaeon]